MRIDVASRRASRGNARARYRSPYRSQHLDRSSGSLIRESRIFGQIGSFSAGMARRTPVGPVRHLCRWVSHGRRPRQRAGEREHKEGKGEGEGGGREGRATVVSRGKGGCKRVGNVSQPSTDFLISRGRPSTRRDATRCDAATPRLDRRAPRDASTFDNPPTSRRKQEGMPAPRMRLSILERVRRGGGTPSPDGRVLLPRDGSDRGFAVLVSSRLRIRKQPLDNVVRDNDNVLAVGHESFIHFLRDCAETNHASKMIALDPTF